MVSKRFIFLIVLLFPIVVLNAQSKFETLEQDLVIQFKCLKEAKVDSVKLNVSNQIMDNLKKNLKKKGSFVYPFDRLTNLGKVSSSDQKLRIYSWNFLMENGEYRYFALIQRKQGKKTKLLVLNHNLETKDDMYSKLFAKTWLGALYYQIIPFKYRNKKMYLLLGWDGNKGRTNKKLIETLSFSKTGEVEFGFPVINWRGKRLSRVIFEYSKEARMKLNYYSRVNSVIFDHLSPSEPRYNNQFEYYGPDFSYDALELKNGIWNLVEDFNMENLN